MQAMSSLRLPRYKRYLPIYPHVAALPYSRAYLCEDALLCGRLHLYRLRSVAADSCAKSSYGG